MKGGADVSTAPQRCRLHGQEREKLPQSSSSDMALIAAACYINASLADGCTVLELELLNRLQLLKRFRFSGGDPGETFAGLLRAGSPPFIFHVSESTEPITSFKKRLPVKSLSNIPK